MNSIVAQELTELEDLIERLRRGEWNRTEFRARSVHYGVYTMRQPDRYLVRIRVPLGMLSAKQLREVSAAVLTWGESCCHLTTRQGLEIHGITLGAVVPLLQALAEVDLVSHETGGNAVRSIMVCPHAGVGAHEPFDVTNYAALLTKSFVRHPDFQNLPRKIKIGFSCCDDDCARTAVQDLGFQARITQQGEPGFRVLVGGGTGALPRLGQELIGFLPANELPIFTAAFLRTFNRLGDRQNRHHARVKFLLPSLGLERLRKEIEFERQELKSQGRPCAAPPVLNCQREASPKLAHQQAPPAAIDATATEAFRAWFSLQTKPQRQDGFRTIRVCLPGGRIAGPQLQALADVVTRFELEVRLTPDQEVLLRWVPADRLGEIHEMLVPADLLPDLAASRVVVCPGSTTCSNAFTNAPGLAQALQTRLAAIPNAASVLGELSIRISGCGNGCGLHAKSDIGLEGLANRIGPEWFPAYRVWLGGRESEQRPCFGADLGMVPARNVPECVAELVTCYLKERQPGESVADLLERIGTVPFLGLVKKFQLEQVTDRHPLMIDWGETVAYRPRTATTGGVC